MSFGKQRPRYGQGSSKKQKSFLSKNKKFTAILLLAVIGSFVGVDVYMIVLHDKVCYALGGNIGGTGALQLWGPCPAGSFTNSTSTNSTSVAWKSSTIPKMSLRFPVES